MLHIKLIYGTSQANNPMLEALRAKLVKFFEERFLLLVDTACLYLIDQDLKKPVAWDKHKREAQTVMRSLVHHPALVDITPELDHLLVYSSDLASSKNIWTQGRSDHGIFPQLAPAPEMLQSTAPQPATRVPLPSRTSFAADQSRGRGTAALGEVGPTRMVTDQAGAHQRGADVIRNPCPNVNATMLATNRIALNNQVNDGGNVQSWTSFSNGLESSTTCFLDLIRLRCWFSFT
ncbi:hypothetical protein BDZ45DRAFT_116759 [Acephala macrosclerotiorum]|nr:hypothetical protein BDZ45DRAFT_116759 [Acephala macrosclerotiorum]